MSLFHFSHRLHCYTNVEDAHNVSPALFYSYKFRCVWLKTKELNSYAGHETELCSEHEWSTIYIAVPYDSEIIKTFALQSLQPSNNWDMITAVRIFWLIQSRLTSSTFAPLLRDSYHLKPFSICITTMLELYWTVIPVKALESSKRNLWDLKLFTRAIIHSSSGGSISWCIVRHRADIRGHLINHLLQLTLSSPRPW